MESLLSKTHGMLVRAVLLTVVLAASAPAARADQGPPAQVNGVGTLVQYVGCAGGLAVSPNMAAAWAALMNCARIIADEWHRAFD